METITKPQIIEELTIEIGKLYAPLNKRCRKDLKKGGYKRDINKRDINKLIYNYELYFDESPDIETIIKNHVDWLTSHNYYEIEYLPKFSSHLITKDIRKIYKEVKQNCSKEYIQNKLSDSILANFIINSKKCDSEEITYLYMVDSLKKLRQYYIDEVSPSPAPVPHQIQSVIHAQPLVNTNEEEIKLLRDKVITMEGQLKVLMDWYNKYSH